MEFIPFPALATIAFTLGAIIGSFASVLTCRMHTGASINTRSHCLSCGRTLTWYELVPVVSYLVLRGRCRTCSARIPVRDFLMEVALGISFVAVVYVATGPVIAVLLAAFVTALMVGTAYDLQHLIIPDEVVWWLSGIAMFIIALRVFETGAWSVLGWSVVAAAMAFLCFAGLWFVSGGRWMGFGDAKLAAPLAALLGPVGTFSLIVLAFWVGAAISLAFIAWQSLTRAYAIRRAYSTRGCITMKSEVPFAPFLIIAFYLVFFFGVDVLALTSYAF